MGLSERWVRKLLARVRKEGDGGIVHRLRGRRSNRRMGEAERERVKVEQRLDGTAWLRFRSSYLKLDALPGAAAGKFFRPTASRPCRQQCHIPPPSHPWRRKFLSG